MLLLKLALRNIMRQKRRSFFTAFSMVLGAALISLVIGLEEGSYANMIDAFTGAQTGHAQIHEKEYFDRPGLYKNFEWNTDIKDFIYSFPEVRTVSPRIFAGVLTFKDTNTTGGMIKGVVPEIEAEATELDQKLVEGKYFPENVKNAVIISNRLSEILKADAGDEIILISQAADGSIANDIFNVTGILSGDVDSLEPNSIFMKMEEAQEYLFLHGKVHQAAVFLDDYNKSVKFAKRINEKMKKKNITNISAEPWEVIESQFYTSMKADQEGSYIAFLIIVIVVAMGVLNTVMMSILERMKEYGVMKAIGTSPVFVFLSILLENTMLAIISSVVAWGIGVLVLWPFHVYGIAYPEPISVGGFMFEEMKAEFVFKAFYLPPLIIIISAVTASLIPAYKAAVADPVKSMKNY